ncbi:GATA transcription factor 5 [Vitis vinifera]|uniref:GATA transcription factor n=1 Tax=Vitis vinifera TaxID=29760 RepID=A0A438I986_VITVI|nr:GATA transcription factor 5 [Vitis vinifera]
MDQCIESRALKESLRREAAMKTTPQVLNDDVFCGAGVNGVSGEDFSVDDLFDFSNGGLGVGFEGEEEEEEEEKDSFSWSSLERVDDDNSNSSSFSGTGDFESLSAGGLAVPADDLEHLEWLSHFVDDSSASELSLLCPAVTGNSPSKRCEEEPRPALLRTPLFPTPLPAKPRSKRHRSSGRAWTFGSHSPSSSPSSSSSSSSTSCLIFANTVHNMESFYSLEKPPAKKPKKSPSADSQPQRRCSHCLVQKTPQWRTGPLGPKTLCNACGVRFKSGRLFPEYRPACSPTFSVEIHSNSHRKVLEIRRKKETAEPVSG